MLIKFTWPLELKYPHIITHPSPYREIGMGYFPQDHLSMQIKPAIRLYLKLTMPISKYGEGELYQDAYYPGPMK